MLPHKAERREGTCKFVCPVPNCNFRKEGSRVYIAKHFRVVHKDYRQGCIVKQNRGRYFQIRGSSMYSRNLLLPTRSWRDLFLDKNAPPIVAVEREISDNVEVDEEEEEEGESEEVEFEVRFVMYFRFKFSP